MEEKEKEVMTGDIPLNTPFDFDGETLVAVPNQDLNCRGCFFEDRIECGDFFCNTLRRDGTNVIFVQKETERKQYKHAKLIKAWADGAEIEFFNTEQGRWELVENPKWKVMSEYRIKPEPKTYKVMKPELKEGEIYIGVIGDKEGNLHHVILLPGDNDDAPWQEQMDWAKAQGGDLPTRIEQAMLYADFSEHFQKDWYWSNTTDRDEGCENYVWIQLFTDSYQFSNHKNGLNRARAVRREKVKRHKTN